MLSSHFNGCLFTHTKQTPGRFRQVQNKSSFCRSVSLLHFSSSVWIWIKLRRPFPKMWLWGHPRANTIWRSPSGATWHWGRLDSVERLTAFIKMTRDFWLRRLGAIVWDRNFVAHAVSQAPDAAESMSQSISRWPPNGQDRILWATTQQRLSLLSTCLQKSAQR